MERDVRPISWIKAAKKDFEDFPTGAQDDLLRALTIVARGGHPDIAKPLKGFGSGVLELALLPPLERGSGAASGAMPTASSTRCCWMTTCG